jgi:hypothetical protein
MAPGPVPYIDGEGGGPNPPYGEDFFQRVVGVHWRELGGGLALGFFVAGNESGSVTFNKTIDAENPTDKTTPINVTWHEIGGLPFTNPPRESGAIYASAFGGSPVLLLGGYRFHEMSHGTWNEGIIAASSDGVSWRQVYSFVGIPYQEEFVSDPAHGIQPHWEGQASSSYIHSIVWDGKQFWAGGYSIDRVVRANDFQYSHSDVLLQSVNGFSWSEAGRNKTTGTDPTDTPDLPKTGLLASHCSAVFTDANGNGVPSGVWDEDPVKKIKIGPANPPTVDYTGTDSRSPSTFIMPIGTSTVVRIIKPNGATTADTGIGGVMGVAFAGGAWWAVGSTMPGDLALAGSAIGAYSVDDGQTWVPADIGLGANATTVSGG